MAKRKRNEYVNNKDFLAALIKYRDDVRVAEAEGKPRPRVPNYIGECIMKIATHLARKPNFINYTFKDDMISDGIENCLQYIDNFNPDKSNNPFAYFTQIIWFAFLRRIQKEKKLLYVKYKMTENVNVMNMTSERQGHDIGSNFDDSIKMSEWSSDYMSNFIKDFEETKRRKVKKRDEKKIDEDSASN
jgi:DNA-directed RNA polymerase specialized sigma subunit